MNPDFQQGLNVSLHIPADLVGKTKDLAQSWDQWRKITQTGVDT